MAEQKAHPFLLFWVGVLTGAIIVGLIFLYKLYGGTGETSVLRVNPKLITPTTTTSTSTLKTMTVNPLNSGASVKIDDPMPW